jgi:hypothetical protein
VLSYLRSGSVLPSLFHAISHNCHTIGIRHQNRSTVGERGKGEAKGGLTTFVVVERRNESCHVSSGCNVLAVRACGVSSVFSGMICVLTCGDARLQKASGNRAPQVRGLFGWCGTMY